ncbi:hypothetical protein IAT40_005013 [Kwoniella sp. CBS 6097]
MADEKKTPKSGSSSKEKSKSKSESKSKRAKASDPKVRAKAKTKAKGKSSESSSSKSSQKASGNNQDAFVLSGLESHAGFLRPLVLQLSSITSFTPLHVLIILFTVFILLHLYLPLFLIPHLSAAVTLVIPIQNTIKSITAQKGSGSKDNGDAPQWLLYWIVYTIIGWMRGTMSLWRPHWRGVFEVGRSASLIVVGGAWFGRKGLKGASKQAERK